jgi:MFS family permease
MPAMTTRSLDRAAAPRPLYLDPNLHIVFAVTWTAMMSVGSLTPIFPSVMEVYGINSTEVGLLITAFTLPGMFLSPVAGLLADRLGRKRVLVPSLLLYAAAGSACAFAPNFEILLALRVLQGCGGAALGSLNNTIIGDLYSGRARIEAIGYNASAQNLTTLSTPLLAGAVALFGWNYPFLLPLIGFVVAYFVAFHLKNPEHVHERQTIGQYVGSAFRSIAGRRMLGLFICSFLSVIIAFGVLMVYIAVLMKERFDADPLTIGIVVAASSIVATLVSTQLARLSQILTGRQLVVWSTLLSAVGVALNPYMPELWLLLIPALVKGIAQGIAHAATFMLMLEEAPPANRAGLMAFNAMVSRFGQTVAPLIFGAVYAVSDLETVFDVGAALLVVTALITGWLLGPTKIEDVRKA